MTARDIHLRTSARAIVQRFRRWARAGASEDHYLAGAADLADLEHRVRELERYRGAPPSVTTSTL